MSVTNRTVFIGDNLPVLRGLDDDSVDLIYLDPPFNSSRNYEAPIGSKAAGAAFKDTWTRNDLDDAWVGEVADRNPPLYAVCRAALQAHGNSMYSYLCMMAPRLMEMRRVLKESGSIYLHCDPTANSYLRLLMDAVFGKENMRNEIIWCYTGPANVRKHFPRKHDTILFYAAGAAASFNRDAVRIPYNAASFTMGGSGSLAKGASGGDYKSGREESLARGKVPESWWRDISSLSVSKERIGYPTQKPLSLLRRIILASSNPGDVVLDPFCGCATACVAAEVEGRQWIGIDLSELAVKLVKRRFDAHHGLMATARAVYERSDVPQRSDAADLPNYRTHKHSLYGKQEGTCAGCRHHFPFRNMTVDHVVPRSKGGDDRPSNLQLLCAACNSLKGNRTMSYLQANLRRET